MQNTRRQVLAGGYGTTVAQPRTDVRMPQEFQLPARHRRPELRQALREMAEGLGVPVRAGAILTGLMLTLGASEARAQEPATGERMRFTVESVHRGAVRLVPARGDSARVVPVDSLSRTIRRGEIVRRCRRPTTDGRVVTWCRDTRANAARNNQ